MSFKSIRVFCVLSMLFASVACFANETPIKNLYQYELDNGLTLFAAENHTVPLVYIEIAVKTGAVSQTPQNAGLFHLYEHMMFKGNSLYKTSEEMQRAISDMGVASWNGTTSTECVNYFFTIPSDQLENGLRFWSAAIRDLLLDQKEFEVEKKVVLSEIVGNISDPNQIAYAAVTKALFPESPWKLDSGGNPAVIENATIEQLRDIQKTYYVPNNAALFVGGDIDPDTVYALTKKIYGDWERGSDPWNEAWAKKPFNPAPFNQTQYYVVPNDQLSPDVAQIAVYFRGADAKFDREQTYAMDLMLDFMNEPLGIYKQTLSKNSHIKLPNIDYCGVGYTTMGRTSTAMFYAWVLSPEDNLPHRAKMYESLLLDGILPKIASSKIQYNPIKMGKINAAVLDNRMYESETAEGLLSTLRFWWISSDADYYYTYPEKRAQIGQKEIKQLFADYFYDKSPVVFVYVNPKVYAATKLLYSREGFTEVTADNAYWWNEAPYKDEEAANGGAK